MTTAVLHHTDQPGQLHAPAASTVTTASLCRIEALRDRSHQLRAYRRRVEVRGSKPAFARSVRCLGGRRSYSDDFPQVTSGANGFAARGGVGAFISRDPLDGQPGTTTESNPYHYTDNNPTDRIDPTGESPNGDSNHSDNGCEAGDSETITQVDSCGGVRFRQAPRVYQYHTLPVGDQWFFRNLRDSCVGGTSRPNWCWLTKPNHNDAGGDQPDFSAAQDIGEQYSDFNGTMLFAVADGTIESANLGA